MPQSNSYRLPTNPGFVGGFNWRGILAALMICTALNDAITQVLAAHFNYQEHLGEPLFRTPDMFVYQPFAWMVWAPTNIISSDETIRNPFIIATIAGLFALGVSALMIGLANILRARHLSKNSEDLRGSASWATEEQIRETGLLDTTQGVYVGGWKDDKRNYIHYLRHNGPEHVLAFAPTRSGKGIGLVIPTLLTWHGSTVVYDIKGENWAKTSGFRAQQGQLCFQFAPAEIGGSSRFNPLAEIRLFTPYDVKDAQNIANILINTGENSESEPYWKEAATMLTTGMVLHVCYAAAAQKRVASLGDLCFSFAPEEPFRDFLEKLLDFPHDPRRKQKWTLPDGQKTRTHPVVHSAARQMLDKADKDFSGVLSNAITALALFQDPLIRANTSASDFTVDDLVNHDKPISLYLIVAPPDKLRLRPLIRLIFTVIIGRLTERMDFEGTTQKLNTHRLLLMVDEFPSLKKMDLFVDALSYMAGYGLKAYLIAQDIKQIKESYGDNESITSNCHVRIAYAPNTLETAKLLSEMAGTQTVQRATYNLSGSHLSLVLPNVSASIDNAERALLTPDEVQRLTPAQLGKGDQADRVVAPGEMLIFLAGRHLIRGTHILYFSDPVLSQRAEIPPPNDRISIGPNGTIEPQPPVNKTANVLSPVEKAPANATATATAEQAAQNPPEKRTKKKTALPAQPPTPATQGTFDDFWITPEA